MVRVAGHPPPRVTWFHRDQPLTPRSPYFELLQQGDAHSLGIREVFREDAGLVVVRAENPLGAGAVLDRARRQK